MIIMQEWLLSEWNGVSNAPVFTRAGTTDDATIVSYAVVEFTGINWNLQRITHEGSDLGNFQTETISDVGDLTRAFILQAQQRNVETTTGRRSM